jgi:transposase InsO family protein
MNLNCSSCAHMPGYRSRVSKDIDVTEVKTRSGKIYTQLVYDNFSRFVICWRGREPLRRARLTNQLALNHQFDY